MNNNLITQMIYRIIFCVLSALACFLSLGFFQQLHGTANFTFSFGFWRYYTNISNYVCFIVGVIVTHDTIKRVRNGETKGFNQKLKTLKFCSTVMIMVTFLVYTALLGDVTSWYFWNSIGNMLYHVACPILFIIDWALFDEHKSLSLLDPLKVLIMPLIYVAYILIYGALYAPIKGQPFPYPYFFLDVNTLGYGGVIIWVIILCAFFLVLSYLMYVYDKLVKVDGKWRLDFSKQNKKA